MSESNGSPQTYVFGRLEGEAQDGTPALSLCPFISKSVCSEGEASRAACESQGDRWPF